MCVRNFQPKINRLLFFSLCNVPQVVSLCQKAALCALRESLECCAVEQRHFEEALKSISPQTSKDTIKYYQDFKKKQTNLFH